MFDVNLHVFLISIIVLPPTVNLTIETACGIYTSQAVLIYIHLSGAQNVCSLAEKGNSIRIYLPASQGEYERHLNLQ
jgi:hypothetical protein